MKALGVNRVVIVVRDMEKAMALYSKLLGATFHDMSATAQAFGLKAAISWDGAIELCEPLPGHDSEIAQFLRMRGEGILGVTWAVSDIEEAKSRAEGQGLGIRATIEFNQEQITEHFQDRFTKFKEYLLADPSATCGVRVMLGQFDLK